MVDKGDLLFDRANFIFNIHRDLQDADKRAQRPRKLHLMKALCSVNDRVERIADKMRVDLRNQNDMYP